MIPSIGRSVHFVLPDDHKHKGQHRAAIISQVWPDQGKEVDENTSVHLHVFSDSLNDPGPHTFVARNCPQDPTGKLPGSWHEPERQAVKPKTETQGKAA